MSHTSDPLFCTHHALRIKGFATVDTLADVTDLTPGEIESHLAVLSADDLARFREARSLWQLTPAGREAHTTALLHDTSHVDVTALTALYEAFLRVNEEFKVLCGSWQLRNGVPNDHSDTAYDAAVIDRLVTINTETIPVVAGMATVLQRLAPYAPRLERTCQKVVQGDTNMFTGVMCGSYHDVWMELHEDLILTQGIDRAREGSF